ncbi:MAG: hypothetical protein ACTSX9_06370 [Candidatus Njordarchaeales archaeon]
MELRFVNPFRRGLARFVAEQFAEILLKATSGLKYVTTIRNVFYVAREIAMKHIGRFYNDYNSFTQDFFVAFKKNQPNSLKELLEKYVITEPRGSWINPAIENEMPLGNRFQKIGNTIVSVEYGIEVRKANKVIVVEKRGLFLAMIANDFHKKLDAILVCTQGYIIERGKLAIQEIAEQYPNIPIIILHDYDVNGILVKETLYKPTKRRDWLALNNVEVIDIGLNWDVIKRFNLDKRAEPVKLSKQDMGKLEYLLNTKAIKREEYEFLKKFRVELNAMTPEEMLQWLEEELEKLGLGKYKPSQQEIDEKAKVLWEERITDYLSWEIQDVASMLINEMLGGLLNLINELKRRATEILGDKIKPPKAPEINADEFYEALKERKTLWWEDLLDEILRDLAWERKDKIREMIEKQKQEYIELLRKDETIQNIVKKLVKAVTHFHRAGN